MSFLMLRTIPLFLAMLPLLHARDITLSPDGEISTPQAAMEAARAEEKPVRIVVSEGTYVLSEALTFGAADSQTTWQAAPGAKPIFSGGREIKAWETTAEGLWKADLPEVREGKPSFDQLWVNGRRATRARTPNKGFFNLVGPAWKGVFPGAGNIDYRTFSLFPEQYPILQNIPPKQRDGALITVTAKWTVSQCRIEALDDVTRSVLIKGSTRYPFTTGQGKPRYFIENIRSALDAPGEWFLDHKAGVLLYHPRPGEEIANSEVIFPVSEKFAVIEGAKDIRFEGLRFRHAAHPYPAEGLFDTQAAESVGGAIEITDSSGVDFENCEISRIGSYGIYYKNGSSDSSVTRCLIEDLGAGGVRIGETIRPADERVTRGISVDNTLMRHGGRMHPSACGVLLTHARGCRVSNCDIGDFYYTGVSFGWNWGYGESLCRDNILENCHIHHIGWSYLSDMGGFYNLGSAPGTVIRGNHIHHVASNHYGGWGLYTDEGSTNVLMENNLVHDTTEAGFHQHYGFHNIIKNNIFAFGQHAQIQRSRNEPLLAFVYQKNIVLWEPGSPLLAGSEGNWTFYKNPPSGYPKDNLAMRNNLYWRTDGKMPEKLAGTWTWQEWQAMGRDQGSLFADPVFQNAAARDFRLKPGSPAEKIGFKPWDLSLAGVRKDDPEWLGLARQGHDYPNWEADAKPWPQPEFRIPAQNFENTPLGSLPLDGATMTGEGKGESIGVSEVAASPIPVNGSSQKSTRSLRVKDAPGLSQSFLPVLNLNTGWEGGTIHVTFDAMAEQGADWFFESRASNGGEFAAGPLVSWRNDGLFAGMGDKLPLAKIPAGEWFRIELTATTGTGKWAAKLTRQDGSQSEHPDLPCKPTWDKSGYLLFASIGQSEASFHIDNLSLDHKP